MKKIVLSFVYWLPFILISCGINDFTDASGSDPDFRSEMRNFVINISRYARSQNPAFAVIPQNGIELVTLNGEDDGELSTDYLNAIDGHGQEDLFYGYDNDDIATLSSDTGYITAFLNVSRNQGKVILVTDYCYTHSKMDDSYSLNNAEGYVSFAADERNLNNIPAYPTVPYDVNSFDINSLSDVRNFLYLINPENFVSRAAFIAAVASTDYDLLIMDLYFSDGTEFSSSEITQLKEKANGKRWMVICYMSIGEAEDYRYYWQASWVTNPPSWLCEEDPSWPGNFTVRYWVEDWQNIIFGNDSSYLKKILDAGFDGVYLDIIDAFEYFE
ncbi:MAG: endo alpha-1,4 polygalactosaminidase [Spirochaetes bacterium]|nr:endo alpha-1,4 polygalactosaminidase [Spirochaetota bacterium]